ncbi:hypothetical protein OKW22_001401 [Bacilli bacterium PM5-3]|nr:hypothetical protein [Bacilli bacterium PM5-3]MDH6604292.1 hypothetical protein [Bacilli bacterium PM5-9]
MKKYDLFIILLFSIILTACSSSESNTNIELKRNYTKIEILSASMFTENDLNSLEKNADIIFLGKTKNEVSKNNSFIPKPVESIGKMPEDETQAVLENEEKIDSPMFISKIEVEEVFKGKLNSNIINIVFNYAVKDNTLVTYEGDQLPSYKGLEYTYFIKKFDSEVTKTINETLNTNYKELYYTISSGTGMVNVDNKDKENIENVENILPKKDVIEIQNEYSE